MRKIFRVTFQAHNQEFDVEALNIEDANNKARRFLISKGYMPSIEARKIELISEPITYEEKNHDKQ